MVLKERRALQDGMQDNEGYRTAMENRLRQLKDARERLRQVCVYTLVCVSGRACVECSRFPIIHNRRASAICADCFARMLQCA